MENQALEDKTRPAIDWKQPIQTTTGERAEVIGERQLAWCGAKPLKLVCVYRGGYPEGSFGDIYQLNDAGQRVDECTPELVSRAVIIRNVPIEIEGWAVVKHYADRGDRGCFRIIGGDIIQSEAEAREFKLKTIKECGSGCRLVRVVMTECGE